MLKKSKKIMLVAMFLVLAPFMLQAKKATIGYQLIFGPWLSAIKSGEFEKATGYDIEWKSFSSGGKVITAMASGNVHLSLAGSSPAAAGISKGVDIEVVWVIDDISSAEALVVRNGSGINTPQDLIGKKIAVPFVSTTHFHMLFALEQFKINVKDVKLLNMQPPNMAAAWERGDIDAGFVWDPALGRLKKNGRVLLTSGILSSWGKATFDALLANKSWAKENKDFVVKFLGVIEKYNKLYRENPSAFAADSKNVKMMVDLIGGETDAVPGILALYDFPDAAAQASNVWLGGGANGGVGKALKATAEFHKSQKNLDKLLDDYSVGVNSEYAKAVADAQ